MSGESGSRRRAPGVPDGGLCSRCRHVRLQKSAKGSVFLRCSRAARDPRFRPYPALPVHECPGYEPEDSETD